MKSKKLKSKKLREYLVFRRGGVQRERGKT